MAKAKRFIGKMFKWIGIILLILIAVYFILRSIGMGINKRTPEGGINESMYVDINGSKQWINIYGQDKDNPVLLYLHGGPGAPSSYIDYVFTRKWSDVYTVVTWDQRNCGMSYNKNNEEVEITKELMLEDGKEMTEFLRDYMGKDKISLVGHSWGSLFGANLALEYPDYYEAFIGTGQCVDIVENEHRLYEAALEWTANDPEGREFMKGWDPDNGFTNESIKIRNGIMSRYGYGIMDEKTDYNMVTALLFNPNYSTADYVRVVRSLFVAMEPYNKFSGEGMKDCSLLGRYDYEVPFYNIDGSHDYQTNYEMACEYFDKVNAPKKKMYVMEGGNHGLLEVRTEEFSEYIHDIAKIQKENR